MRIPPRLLQELGLFWGLRDAQVAHLWQALSQSRWSRACGWKAALLAADQAGCPLAAVLGQPLYTPYATLKVLGALVREYRLSRAAASAMEVCLLQQVVSPEQWVGLPALAWPAVEDSGLDLAYTIEDHWPPRPLDWCICDPDTA